MRLFDFDFELLDDSHTTDLLTLEREGAVYADLWIDRLGDFRHVKIAFTQAETDEYVRSMKALELFLRAGSPNRAADVPGIPADIAARADSYPHWVNGKVVGTYHCPAAFIGPDLEELVCTITPRTVILEELGTQALLTTIKRAIDSLTPAIRRFNKREKGLTPWPISREDDVRDLLYAILRASIEDLKLEEPTPSRGGTFQIVDLCSTTARLFIEVKWIAEPGRWRRVIDEIRVDCQAYGAHPSCRTLVFVVIDAAKSIPDPRLIEQELSGTQVIGGHHVDMFVFVREP